ncbi:MAG: biotin transporter BioY [Candidatus Methylomirabilales bacterium]
MAERELIGRSGVAPTATWLVQRAVSGTIGVAAFAVMTALGAHVRIPLPWTPVPITLQTFFVQLAGATLGPTLGPASQAVYLLAGATGLPVFAGGGSGLLHLLRGVTTGYLIGFVVATALVGRLVRLRRDPGFQWILLSMAAGSLVVYACGVFWLAWSLGLSLPSAIAQGMLPFLVGDAVKTCAAAGLFRGYRRRARVVFP